MRLFVADIVARLQTFRYQAVELSVSGMSVPDDGMSLVGGTSHRMAAIDRYPWGRAALDFTGVSFAQHEKLAKKVGTAAAAEVLLMMITNECGTDDRKWRKARNFGIPWQHKTWTFVRRYMEHYNAAVAQDQVSTEESADLSVSSDSERTWRLAGTSDGAPPKRGRGAAASGRCAGRRAPRERGRGTPEDGGTPERSVDVEVERESCHGRSKEEDACEQEVAWERENP